LASTLAAQEVFHAGVKEEAQTIPADLEAQILRYYHVEKWRTGTIARQLHVHPETVARVLAQAGQQDERNLLQYPYQSVQKIIGPSSGERNQVIFILRDAVLQFQLGPAIYDLCDFVHVIVVRRFVATLRSEEPGGGQRRMLRSA
jgi:hypothetical protein